jgi:hypothetical protein
LHSLSIVSGWTRYVKADGLEKGELFRFGYFGNSSPVMLVEKSRLIPCKNAEKRRNKKIKD